MATEDKIVKIVDTTTHSRGASVEQVDSQGALVVKAVDTTVSISDGFSIGEYDYVGITRVSGGAADGEIETVVFKTGGAGGTTVATLTLAYDVNGDLSSVTKS